MNDSQRNKLNMYQMVSEFLTAAATITNKLVVFGALFASFTVCIRDILAVSEEQERDKTGVAKQKKGKRADLITKIMGIAKRCEGFASGINDLTFMNAVTLLRSKLEVMADADLIKKAEDLVTIVTPRLADLEPYNVVAADLTALTTLKNEFAAIYLKPMNAIESTAELTARLNQFYRNADDLLKKIDKEVGTIFDTEPEFYANYLRKRAIVKLATRKRAFEMWVIDEDTALAIAKATVTITSKAKAGTELTKSVKKTGSKGGIIFNNLAAGEYDYEVSFGGYVKETGTFYINDGVKTTVNVKMKRASVPVV